MAHRILLSLLSTILASTSSAAAEGAPGTVANEFLLGVTLQRSWELTNDRADDWAGAGFGAGYQFTRRFYFLFQGFGHRVSPDTGETSGGELQLTFRGNLYFSDPAVLFVEGGAGIIGTFDRFPPSGSRFNFTEHLGFGVLVPLGDQVSFTAGARYQHLSNAGLFGSDDNPGIDGATAFVTFLFTP